MKENDIIKYETDMSLSGDLDQLTGLMNRFQFEQKLKQLVEDTRSTRYEHALFQIDIDSFKVVNDVHGNAAGDALLCSITNIIGSCIQSEDLISRLGNDEFGVIIKHCSYGKAHLIGNTIRESIKHYRVSSNQNKYGVTVSIGVTMISSETPDYATVLRNAGVACYVAKYPGDKVHIYHHNDRLIATYHEDMKWINNINNAFDNDLFELYTQRIFPLSKNNEKDKSVLCEILLRLKDQDGNIILPGKFLPVAARHNMASRIDYWVIRTVINLLEQKTLSKHCSKIMINLSGQSLGDEMILDYLMERLERVEFPTESLCFEITEAETIKNFSSAINFINKVKNKYGCLFALDDFGSGFSSFKYIKELPVDIIKIDGSFVKDILTEPVSEIMIRSLNDIAKVTHKKTIAEWVESEEVFNTLQKLGVDYAQGYFLGEPVPFSEFTDAA